MPFNSTLQIQTTNNESSQFLLYAYHAYKQMATHIYGEWRPLPNPPHHSRCSTTLTLLQKYLVQSSMEISSSFSLLEENQSMFAPGPVASSFSDAKKRTRDENNDSASFEELLSKLLAFDGGSVEETHALDLDGFSLSGYPNLTDADTCPPPKRPRVEADEIPTTSDDTACAGNGVPHRRLWVKNRSKAWWEQVNSPEFPEAEFKKEFGMSRETFDIICQQLESVVTKKDTMLRSAIPVRQRVAVCIWRLATGEALREVSRRFGLGISTCHKLVLEVSRAIKTELMPKFLQWPDEAKIRDIKREFESTTGIQNVCGTMYTTHIPIIAPKANAAAYFNKRHTERNQKPSYSVTVQGVVDPNGIFTDISIGWPGSMADDQVLEKSALYQRGNAGLLKESWIVGNSGYPLMDWFMVPYTHPNLSWAQHAYNERIEELQGIGKDSFARLKARWGCLQKRTEMKLEDLPLVLAACCILHNICEMRNEGISPDTTKFEMFDDAMIAENSMGSVNAMITRDQIAHKLLHHNHAGSSLL